MEARALSRIVLKANPAAMIVHNFGDNRKSQADAVSFRSEKGIEDLLAQAPAGTPGPESSIKTPTPARPLEDSGAIEMRKTASRAISDAPMA